MAFPPWRSIAAPTMQASAYSSVDARRDLNGSAATLHSAPLRSTYTATSTLPTAAAPPAPPAAAPTKINWPEGVRHYVQRALAAEAQISGIEKTDVQTKLKAVISEATFKEELYTTNWNLVPLPQELIRAEREQRARQNHEMLTHLQTFEPFPSTNNMNAFAGKKRKSGDFDVLEPEAAPMPPWRQANTFKSLADRVTYSTPDNTDQADRKRRKHINEGGISKYEQDLERRRNRFQNGNAAGRPPQQSTNSRSSPEPVIGPVVGTSQALEKKYLRLTSAPKPENVRPLAILEQTLELLKTKWKQDRNYGYICDQFKSLRQDLTVQHIKNDFTVTVYEIHARIALEKGDLGEYNQCQTQLKALYSQRLDGNPAEFLAYRILYFIHTNNRSGMTGVLADLTPVDKAQPAVVHALKVRSALALGNYHKFFQLYLDTPNMGAYLMDMFVERERLAALANICKAYKLDVSVRFVTEELGFENDQECWKFISTHNGDHLLQEKNGSHYLATGKAGLLFETAKNRAFGKVDIKGQI